MSKSKHTLDFHFWIKGSYNELNNRFSFHLHINPEITNEKYLDFLKIMKRHLEIPRSLQQTELFIQEMIEHEREQVREIGSIIRSDQAWASYLMDNATEGETDDSGN